MRKRPTKKRYKKKPTRDYNDKFYKIFRQEVRKRDRSTCRWPNCGAKKKIQVHHIRKWSRYPKLRYDKNNGICLCKKHHDIVTRNEESYESLFLKIIHE